MGVGRTQPVAPMNVCQLFLLSSAVNYWYQQQRAISINNPTLSLISAIFTVNFQLAPHKQPQLGQWGHPIQYSRLTTYLWVDPRDVLFCGVWCGYGVQTYSWAPRSHFSPQQESARMSLVDLSYTFSEDDQSIWPGNQPFRKTVVADHSDNCIMASVGLGLGWTARDLTDCVAVQHQHERACWDSHGRPVPFLQPGLDHGPDSPGPPRQRSRGCGRHLSQGRLRRRGQVGGGGSGSLGGG